MRGKNCAVATGSNINLIFLELGVPLDKKTERNQELLGGHLISNCLAGVGSLTVAHTGRPFQVNHVGLLIPGILIDVESVAAGLQDEGTVLLHHGHHAGAGGSAGQPHDQGVGGWPVLGLEVYVVDRFSYGRDADVQIPYLVAQVPE